jgi:NADH/NAD ratio-sensing transcriptional regulator Rex
LNKSLFFVGALALVGFAILGKSLLQKNSSVQSPAAQVAPVPAAPVKAAPIVQQNTDSLNQQNALDNLKQAAATCESEVQEITVKYLELKAMVDALIKKEEDRVINWEKSQKITETIKDESRKGNLNFAKKMQDLLLDHEKKLTAIKADYMKACPCAVN